MILNIPSTSVATPYGPTTWVWTHWETHGGGCHCCHCNDHSCWCHNKARRDTTYQKVLWSIDLYRSMNFNIRSPWHLHFNVNMVTALQSNHQHSISVVVMVLYKWVKSNWNNRTTGGRLQLMMTASLLAMQIQRNVSAITNKTIIQRLCTTHAHASHKSDSASTSIFGHWPGSLRRCSHTQYLPVLVSRGDFDHHPCPSVWWHASAAMAIQKIVQA